MKRIFPIFVCIVLCLSCTVFPAFAADCTNYANTESADWIVDSYIGSGGVIGGNSGTVVTNYIPASLGDTIRLKNLSFSSGHRIAFYDSDKAYINVLSSSVLYTNGCISIDDTTGIQTLVNLGATTPDGAALDALSGTAYIRFVADVTDGAEPVIAVNEIIPVDSSVSVVPDAPNKDYSETPLSELVYQLFGTYTPRTQTVTVLNPDGSTSVYSEIIPGLAGLDWNWLLAAALFLVTMYCVLRMIGGVLKWN